MFAIAEYAAVKKVWKTLGDEQPNGSDVRGQAVLVRVLAHLNAYPLWFTPIP